MITKGLIIVKEMIISNIMIPLIAVCKKIRQRKIVAKILKTKVVVVYNKKRANKKLKRINKRKHHKKLDAKIQIQKAKSLSKINQNSKLTQNKMWREVLVMKMTGKINIKSILVKNKLKKINLIIQYICKTNLFLHYLATQQPLINL